MSYPEIRFTVPDHQDMYSIEGIDGAGKTTQANRVGHELIRHEISVATLTNPSNTPLGKFLRENLGTLPSWQRFTLFVMDMLDVLSRSSYKDIIIWDRYIDSTIVSNSDTHPDLAALWVNQLPRPKHAFFLDIDPISVLKKRSGSLHDHSLDISHQKLKYSRYKELISRNPDRFTVVDGSLPEAVITERIASEIVRLYTIKK